MAIPKNGWIEAGAYLIGGLASTLLATAPQAAQAMTLIYENGFGQGQEVVGGGIGALWTDDSTETAPTGETYLGRYRKQTGSVLNLDGLDTGTKKVTVSFDLYIIGSWDGNHVVSEKEADKDNPKNEGDYFSLAVTGGETFLDTSFSNSDTKFTNRWQGYSPDDINGDDAPLSYQDAMATILGYAPGTGSEFYNDQTGTWIDRNPLGFSAISGDPLHKNDDKQAIYRNLTFTFDYTDEQLGLEFFGNTTARDEGYGLDNVRVWVETVPPEPPVDVPEPSAGLGLLAVSALGAVYGLKNKKNKS